MDAGFSFPPELEREILETAALCHPDTIPALLRVCHRVHIWIEPLLYKAMVLSNEPQLSAAESKDPTFLQNAVRDVYLHHSYHADDLDRYKRLFLQCCGIVNLSIDSDLDDVDLLHALRQMRLRRLALSVPSLVSRWTLAGFTHPLFLSVTHLDLFQSGPDEDQSEWRNWSGIASLPELTHLALSPSIAIDILADVLRECPRLAVAVVMTYPWKRDCAAAFIDNPTLVDPRLVVMASAVPYAADWKLGASGGDDFWVRAEMFINRKRAGEIDKTSHLLDELATIH